MQQTPKIDIFQKPLFYILAFSKNLVLNAVPIAVGQYLKRDFTFLLFLTFHCIFKEVKLKEKFSDNLRHIICRLFPVLVQFLFTTSETELDYYNQKMIV